MIEKLKKPKLGPTVGDALQTALPGDNQETLTSFDDTPFPNAGVDALFEIDLPPLPDILYHYTTAEGLLGLVGGNTLRFSDTKFVNDGSEMAWGRWVLENHLKERFASAPEKQQQFWQSVLKRTAESGDTFRHVIFCMSREGNLLNQWRDYGRDVVPYSIGLETTYFFKRDAGTFETNLTPLVYAPAHQMKAVENLVSRIAEVMKSRWNSVSPDHLVADSYNASFELSWLVSQFKNPAFEPEQEVRLQLTHYALTRNYGAKPKFRTSMLGVVPYYEWRPATGSLPIRSVLVGPSPHASASLEALRIYLAELGLGDVTSNYSTIPIRR